MIPISYFQPNFPLWVWSKNDCMPLTLRKALFNIVKRWQRPTYPSGWVVCAKRNMSLPWKVINCAWCNIEEPWKHHAKWNKLNTREQIAWEFAMKNPKWEPSQRQNSLEDPRKMAGDMRSHCACDGTLYKWVSAETVNRPGNEDWRWL